MMVSEPLRSATAIGIAEDTSLALPSDHNLSSGQQRVLDQVHTIKRSKSRQSRNGTLSPSPTSLTPTTLTYSEFGAFKFSPTKVNGTFSRTSSAMSAGYDKAMHTQRSRSTSARTTAGRHVSNSGTWEQQISISNWPQKPNGLKPSRSDPALVPPFSAVPVATMKAKGQTAQNQNTVQARGNRQSTHSKINGTYITTSQTRMVRPPSIHSHNEGKMGTLKISKIGQTSAVNSGLNMSDLTLKEAVEFLSHPEENYQQCGATFIQHTTFNEDSTKAEVLQLRGIPALVTLLRSPNPDVSQVAAGALRNLVFKDQKNKLVVQDCGGIAKALQLLQETDSTETQKQVTGLLWNLSSADDLKKELTATALPALTKNVVMPFNSWSDSSGSSHIDPSVFYFATGCLRNLSCGIKNERQAMRTCPGLIDSLMSYLQSCVAEENPDDKSVENCACILHNLTYQLEQECPESFSNYYPQKETQAESKKSPTVGCFSPRSSKAQKEFCFDESQALPGNGAPSGVKWLCHPKAVDVYLALLSSSQNDATLEASCGALQNLTASGERGSTAVSQILIQKLKSLFLLPSLLKSPNQTLQKTALSLLDNMSRPSSLQASMAKFVLPELTSLLSNGAKQMGNSDEAIATACSAVRRLIVADNEVSKKVINSDLVYSLAELSENESLPKGSKAASVLLYSIWSEKNLQSIVKKLGMNKSLFHNEKTTAAHQSVQIIE
ncbi:plakophilin-1 [Melanotaenia boesemani]|uniref:plakophilin-1 n=1 Tax=Melanotaenia boesemani TaxID=1250792 RepID=UPI001C0553D7|nr:plakophilin-1 [Melanotaenia boesemani]XP_041860423.1 plakophilin-1 [Melanotaenia boesemani]